MRRAAASAERVLPARPAMIRRPLLTPRERAALDALVAWARAGAPAELLRALLFGSRARGDHDEASDLDVLLVFATDDARRPLLARRAARAAAAVAARTGVPLQTWTLGVDDLAVGRRTPMLVDAMEDAVPLWPPRAPPPALAFTPADAAFCAGRLLGWVGRGEHVVARALERGERDIAARRVRDDITRLATAALLVTGDTRHRRIGSLLRFRETFLDEGGVPGWREACSPALAWAVAAYPPDGGRGSARPPASAIAAATVEAGRYFAGAMRSAVVPWIRRRVRALRPSTAQDGARRGRRTPARRA